jgi:hypothetical protein
MNSPPRSQKVTEYGGPAGVDQGTCAPPHRRQGQHDPVELDVLVDLGKASVAVERVHAVSDQRRILVDHVQQHEERVGGDQQQ